MFLGTILPFVFMVVISPFSCLGLLFPPEGNDYPLYDFPSVQYMPHNTLVEYQDPWRKQENFRTDNDDDVVEDEEETDDGGKMEVATRSKYFPIMSPKDTLIPVSSPSAGSYPYPPPPPPPPFPPSSSFSSLSSSESLRCTTEDIAKMLNTEDLEKMIKVVAKIEGMSERDLIVVLGMRHGLQLKSGHRGAPESLQNLQLLDPSSSPSASQRPLIHLRRPPKGILPTAGNRERAMPEEPDLFEPVAIEVPAMSPRGLEAPLLMQALVVVEDGSSEEVARLAVDLGPRMALLDVLKEAKLAFALDNGPYRHNPFTIKARKLVSERCLGLQSVGRVNVGSNSALLISVTRTRPQAEIVWESPCLPRVADLLIRPGDVVVLAPR